MRRNNHPKGLTLIETLVTLAVLTAIMVGLYALLDSSNKLAKQETNVAEAQQSVRIGISELTRVIRQGRVGGLFIANAILPIANNIGGGTTLTDTNGTPHYVRAGTDVIGVRGIISGDKYGLGTGDVTCAGSCATTNAMTVTIRATSSSGVVNFVSPNAPSIAGKKSPFYFVVADGSTEMMTTGVGTYLVPVYYVGRVNANSSGTWYTLTTDQFTFTMDPQDSDARNLAAQAPSAPALDKPFSGGVVDDIRFFVDEGSTSAGTDDTHPSLAEAIWDPSSRNWEIQPLIEDVEDFQVAYGVDGIVTGSVHDHGISPAAYNTTANNDEWVGNVGGEVASKLTVTGNPPRVEAFIDSSVPTGPSAPAIAEAALRSVMVGLVVKSADPDLRYDGPGARGFSLLDSTAVSFSTITGRPYRRRLQRFAVSLRNYQ